METLTIMLEDRILPAGIFFSILQGARMTLDLPQALHSLRLPQGSIDSASCQQGFMRTFFGDLSVIKDEDPVCLDNR